MNIGWSKLLLNNGYALTGWVVGQMDLKAAILKIDLLLSSRPRHIGYK